MIRLQTQIRCAGATRLLLQHLQKIGTFSNTLMRRKLISRQLKIKFYPSCIGSKKQKGRGEQLQQQQPQKVPNIYRTQNNILQANEFKKKIKKSQIKVQQFFHEEILKLPNVSYQLYSKRDNHDQRNLPNDEKPVPYSQKMDKFTIINPPIFPKTYFWCSCGLSSKQPFCDNSHKGTLFKPIKFSLEEKVSQIHLCGCKYSTNSPYCDGVTCSQLREMKKKPVDQIASVSENIEDKTQFKEPISLLNQLRKDNQDIIRDALATQDPQQTGDQIEQHKQQQVQQIQIVQDQQLKKEEEIKNKE